jgi:hypothetical protein
MVGIPFLLGLLFTLVYAIRVDSPFLLVGKKDNNVSLVFIFVEIECTEP